MAVFDLRSFPLARNIVVSFDDVQSQLEECEIHVERQKQPQHILERGLALSIAYAKDRTMDESASAEHPSFDQLRRQSDARSSSYSDFTALTSPLYTPNSSLIELSRSQSASSLAPSSGSTVPACRPTTFLSLPSELIDHVLEYLGPRDFANLSGTSRRLRSHALNDAAWQRFVQENVAAKLETAGVNGSFRELYIQHHNRWFIPHHKIWYADSYPYGRLLYARYDQERSCIEAYQVTAQPGTPLRRQLTWKDNEQVVYMTFHPRIGLDLNKAAVTLLGDFTDNRRIPLGEEIPMPSPPDEHSRVELNFLHTSAIDARDPGRQTLWPPSTLPSPGQQRTLNESPSGFRSLGHVPTLSRLSTATFRVRQWIEFTRSFPPGVHVFDRNGRGSGRIGETIATYATLPAECYTPTAEKPWQGLWCGDYSAHGVEYLVVMQRDAAEEIPAIAAKALASWPNTDVDTLADVDDEDDDDNEDDVSEWEEFDEFEATTDQAATTSAQAGASLRRRIPRSIQPTTIREPNNDDVYPYKGQLIATKLTGDPNIPRGEISFIAPDIGAHGVVGLAHDPVFFEGEEEDENDPTFARKPGKRIVRSVGHVAQHGFRNEAYLPSQLVLASDNRLAQYWERLGVPPFVSFYQRVDLDAFVTV
jgi:hypothetical protein